MLTLMTRQFNKWALKQNMNPDELNIALMDIKNGSYEANLGGHLLKKRIKLKGKGKSGGARTIICYRKGDRAIFIHGFSKNEKSNLSTKELIALKSFAKTLLSFSETQILIAIKNGDLLEVRK